MHGWCKVVLETHGGLQHFDFECQPSPTSSQHAPAQQQGRKRWVNMRKRVQENLRRAAWVERHPPLQTSLRHVPSQRKCSYSSSLRGSSRSSNSRHPPDSSSIKNSSSSYNSSCRVLCGSCSLISYKCTSSSSSSKSSCSNNKGCCSSKPNVRCIQKAASNFYILTSIGRILSWLKTKDQRKTQLNANCSRSHNLKGLTHEIFGPVYWPVCMHIGLNKNRF
jgi:hypothetical protein